MSPRLPRDISESELAGLLGAFGYEVTRQKGPHLRLTTFVNGEHHITIPNHNPLRLGTLGGILRDVAEHDGQTKEVVAEKLFG